MEVLEISTKNQNNEANSTANQNEDLAQIINQFFNTLKDKNGDIKEPKDWDNLDIFDINELERIKNTPEYIIEKIKIHIKDFLTLNEYFYNLRKAQNINANDNAANFLSSKKNEKKKTIGFESQNTNNDEKKQTGKEENNIKNETKGNNNSIESNKNVSENLNHYHSISSNDNENQSNFSINFNNESNNSGNGKEKEKDNKEIKEMDIFKFKFLKQKLNLEDEENLSGKTYEEYVRKTIKLMFLLAVKKLYSFKNPKNIDIFDIQHFYMNLVQSGFLQEIDIPLINLNFKENKCFEADIVFELTNKELKYFVNKFTKKIFFEEYLFKEKEGEKITLFVEIAKNIISQGKEKMEQINKYIEIINIMNLAIKNIVVNNGEYIKICNEYKCSAGTKKKFCLITDGNFDELKFVLNDIIKGLLVKYSNEKDLSKIKAIIREKLNSQPNMFVDVINKESLIDNIYYVFQLVCKLRIYNINFCIIYIGEICENNSEKLLEYLNQAEYLNDKGKKFYESVGKKNSYIIKLKEIYNKIKKEVKEFEKKCENNILFYKEDINKAFAEVDLNVIDNKKFISSIKIPCYCYVLRDNNEKNKKYENKILSKIKADYEFKVNYSEYSFERLNNIFVLAKKNINELFFVVVSKEINLIDIIHLLNIGNDNVCLILYGIKGQGAFFIRDKFINKNNLERLIKQLLNNNMKLCQNRHTNDEKLMPNNLLNKIINDFKFIFQTDLTINLNKIIEKIKFEISEDKMKNLIASFDSVMELIGFAKTKNDYLYNKIKTTFTFNLDELIKNILSRYFYSILLYRSGVNALKELENKLLINLDNIQN